MDEVAIDKIISPYYWQRIENIKKQSDINLAYYTSLRNVHNILSNHKIWLRNVSCMNDFYEIRQGAGLLRKYFLQNNSEKLKQLVTVLCQINSDPGNKWECNLKKILDEGEAALWYDTYITSLTVHDKKEDADGRLSMWRAYGRGSCGALIFDKDKIFGLNSSYFPVVLSPVAYLTDEQFYDEADKVILSIKNHIEELKTVKPSVIWGHLRNALIYAICSLKHPGFEEEKEWRIIYIESPNSPLNRDIECINNVPQYVYKLDLERALGYILDHIIIGPIEYITAPYTVLKDDLKQLKGDNNVEMYIKKSNITIRPHCL